MTTLFISDLHLSSKRPETSELFLRFLKEEAKNIDALYILGDFFEVWIGDDTPNVHDNQMIEALREFSKTCPVYFMCGNRDFLISRDFERKSGATLLPDPSVIELYGKPIVLAHGDALCSLDARYQRFRKFVRHPWVKKLFLKLPLSIRHHIANAIRHSSSRPKSKSTTTKKQWQFDVALKDVYQALRKFHSHVLIHGHTHVPKIHDFILNDQPAKRIVLGEWTNTGSVLVYSPEKIQLKTVL